MFEVQPPISRLLHDFDYYFIYWPPYTDSNYKPLARITTPMQKSKVVKKQTTSVTPTISQVANINVNVNPWTNKVKIRGEGLLNSIMSKYLDQDGEGEGYTGERVSEEEKGYLRLAERLGAMYESHDRIDEGMKGVFELQKRCEKIDQLLEWLEKIQSRSQRQPQSQPQQTNKNKQRPVESSFIYLPLHSGTVFHEIIEDCLAKDKKGIGEYRNMKLKGALDDIKGVYTADLSGLLDANIL